MQEEFEIEIDSQEEIERRRKSAQRRAQMKREKERYLRRMKLLQIGVPVVLACILGSVIHLIRMKVSKKNNLLAMGPYLSLGIFIAALWGNHFWNWYMSLMIS